MNELLREARQLASFVTERAALPFSGARRFSWGHVGAIVTDSILQAGMNYMSVVQPRVLRVRAHSAAQTTSGFLCIIREVGAERLLSWRGRRPQRVTSLAEFLRCEGLETASQIRCWIGDEANRTRLLALDGVGQKTVDYFASLCGQDGVAVDRHVRRFVSRSGVRRQSYEDVRQIVEWAADLLGVRRSDLDAAIWRFESTMAKAQEDCLATAGLVVAAVRPCP